MWKDIVRRRWIVNKHHPESCFFKLAAAFCCLTWGRGAFFMALSAELTLIMVNLLHKEEDYFLPLSDQEHKKKRVEESIYFSGIFSGLLLIHNLVFYFILQDPFTVENGIYLLMLNLLTFMFGISAGISMGNENKKKSKTIPAKMWEIFQTVVCGFFIGQVLDLLVLKGGIYKRIGIYFLNPSWYVPVACIIIILEMIAIISNYRKIKNHDMASIQLFGVSDMKDMAYKPITKIGS